MPEPAKVMDWRHTSVWAAIRTAWQKVAPTQCQATPCYYRGTPIQYGGRRGPFHLDIGHKVEQDRDSSHPPTMADTRPEHSYCNSKNGSLYRHHKHRKTTRMTPITSQKW